MKSKHPNILIDIQRAADSDWNVGRRVTVVSFKP